MTIVIVYYASTRLLRLLWK